MRVWTQLLLASPLILGAPLAWSIPSGTLPAPTASDSASQGKADTVATYNTGVRIMQEADRLDAAAAKVSGAAAHAAAQKKAHDAYARARAKFEIAVHRDPEMAEAWNNLGYTERQLGSYNEALTAYAQALALKPGFPQALEYRAVAYLALNRLDAAKRAYLDLFDKDRAAADQLMVEMQHWVSRHEKDRGTVDAATLSGFAKWVQERSHIAAETASLTRAGTAANWN